MKKYDVICFGSAILDVSLKSPDFRIVKSKNAFVQQLLTVPYGIKSEVSDLIITSGGGGTNTAVGLIRLGLQTAVVARCGWDFAGKMIRQELKKEKVKDEFLNQIEGEKTDYSTILIGPDGNRTILVYRGGTKLESSLLDFKKLNSFWFYIASLEGNLDLLEELVEFADKNKIKVVLNPGKKEIEQKERLLKICQKATVLIVNEQEANQLANSSLIEGKIKKELNEILSKAIVVITQGEKGAVLFQPNKGKLVMDSFKVKMIDQTGAGDGFGSGFIGGLVKQLSIENCLKLGVANGASVVTKIGAKTGLIKHSEIDYWLEKPLKYRWVKR
ncbi:MAG: carbohydrate kinase family protein [Candidatus Shapirobacteria bacterium]|nr:carbohydrate kinase family protein [Candidatus Shapirobacteria bacterium]